MKSLLLSLVALFSIAQIQAQYTFSTSTDTYQPLSGDTEIEENDYDTDTWNDPEFMVNLGFDFIVEDEAFSQIFQRGIGAEIVLDNGSSLTAFAYRSDLIDVEVNDEKSVSTISYLMDGDMGSHIFKLQYHNCAFYEEVVPDEGTPNSTNRINFQIWLYEGSNAFEIRFGPHSITDSELIHNGSPGPDIMLITNLDWSDQSFDYSVSLAGDPIDPVVEIHTELQIPFGLADEPSEGTVYRFEPGVTSIDDVVQQERVLFPSLADESISLQGEYEAGSKFHIYDISGKTLLSGIINQGEPIDVSKLAPGLYVFQLNADAETYKFTKR